MRYERIELDLIAHASQKYIVRARVVAASGKAIDRIAKEKSLEKAQEEATKQAKEAFEEEFGASESTESAEAEAPSEQPGAVPDGFISIGPDFPSAEALRTLSSADASKDFEPGVTVVRTSDKEAFAALKKQLHPRQVDDISPYASAIVAAGCQGGDVKDNDCDGQVDDVQTPAPQADPAPATEDLESASSDPVPTPEPPQPTMVTLRERYPALALMLTDLGAEEIAVSIDPEERHAKAREMLLKVVQQGQWKGNVTLTLADLKEICQRLHGTRQAKDLSAEIMEQLADQIAAGPTEGDLQVAAVQREYLFTNDFSHEPFAVDEIMSVAETPWSVVLVSEVIREWNHAEQGGKAA